MNYLNLIDKITLIQNRHPLEARYEERLFQLERIREKAVNLHNYFKTLGKLRTYESITRARIQDPKWALAKTILRDFLNDIAEFRAKLKKQSDANRIADTVAIDAKARRIAELVNA